MKKLKKVLTNPKIVLLYAINMNMNIFRFLPNKLYIRIKYKVRLNKKVNLKNPRNFNEKLQWLKLYDKNPLYTNLVDKYKVRNYVKECIGQEYLIPLLGVWDDFNEINFSQLPDKFVLKCTHDSGSVFICKDKYTLNYKDIKSRINKALKKNYYYLSREWPYKNVKPRIICEKYLADELNDDLKDYKFMCFNGKVKCCFVCSNRSSSTGFNIDIYDTDWNKMSFERVGHPNSQELIERPINYKKMIELSEKLSEDIPFIRVDFYEVNEKIYFGELTFFPGAGFEEFTPESYDYLLGSWIKLPQKRFDC